ncbi:MAG: DedA family protein [Ancrocorticia sp.]|jgi:membrane protein DedA with SNARE-associated domain|nr:DedA family protein [Ancrocorticia sp.]MCI2013481.1 DedA family protein [Ancrocorticia sp.]MCI2178185.1 DedA family protein [Ancrocorticia sp.]MCI2194315.1 DedA family protein [Ancrocorticia sp.]MCI2199650.1 DedA family protein [Ancrocorticia sp.]
MDALGGFGAGFLIALENVFPPLPSEIILPLAGFTAGAGGSFTLVEAILWCTGGSIVGAWALYAIGALLGRERTRRFMRALPLVKESDVIRTEAFFDRRGAWTVFFGRMIPIFRSLISIPAGVTRMNAAKFTLLTTLGSAIWNTILIFAGYALGANWGVVENYVGVLSRIVVGGAVILLAWWIARRIMQNRREARLAIEGGDAAIEQLGLEKRPGGHGENAEPDCTKE